MKIIELNNKSDNKIVVVMLKHITFVERHEDCTHIMMRGYYNKVIVSQTVDEILRLISLKNG